MMMMMTTTIKRGLSSNENIKTMNRKVKEVQMQEALYRHSRKHFSWCIQIRVYETPNKTYCRKGGRDCRRNFHEGCRIQIIFCDVMLCRWASSSRCFERMQSISPSKLTYCGPHKFQFAYYVAHVYVPSASVCHRSQELNWLLGRVAELTTGKGKLN